MCCDYNNIVRGRIEQIIVIIAIDCFIAVMMNDHDDDNDHIFTYIDYNHL